MHRLLLCLVLCSSIWHSTGEEECMKSTYWCYECNSHTDTRCRDPFNASAPSAELPPLRQCEGCCVKIVVDASTPKEVVRRTCTKSLLINLFMVDHVCMYEGGNTGHMCFCERDNCNAATRCGAFPFILFLLATALLLHPLL